MSEPTESKPVKLCEWCGKIVTKRKNRFCDQRCSAFWRMSQPAGKAQTAALLKRVKENHPMKGRPRPDAAKRMRENNPMKEQETRKKVSESLKAKGHKPLRRGGNGHVAPVQNLLFGLIKDAASLPAEMEFTVSVSPRVPNRPTCYKIDIALPDVLLAIEVDGPSHGATRVQKADAKKSEFLSERGWTVLRFKNKEILQDNKTVLKTILYTISKLKETTTTSLAASS